MRPPKQAQDVQPQDRQPQETRPKLEQEKDENESKAVIDEPPPFLGSWPRVYRFVLVYVAFVIFLLWLFTQHYSPAHV
jgi:hypothetical protein